MKEVGYNVKCTKGNVIKLHDVCRSVSTNEIVIVGEGVNKEHQIKGLVADNEVTGAGDWLSVYPDGELEVLCNLKDGASEMDEQKPYYYEIGAQVLVCWEGKWQEGRITNGYRTHDGVINVQLPNGECIWFGETRHKEYLKPILTLGCLGCDHIYEKTARAKCPRCDSNEYEILDVDHLAQ